MRKIIYLLVMVILLSGCATMFEDMKIVQAENQGRFYIGMPISEVTNVVGRQPNCIFDACKTENTSEGTYKIWVVNGGGMGGNFARTYNFKFKDDKLVSWGWQ